MTAQKRNDDRLLARRGGSGPRGSGAASRAAFAVALIGCVLPAVGCKTGSSFTKPSWWTFGGTPKDADSLAAAPPYGGDITKPSLSAKPYPTTSTPSGYVITGSTSPGDAAAQQFQAAQPQAPVVYGSTPAPQSTPAAATAAMASAPQQTPASSIAPQVGPYAALAGDTIPPPGQPLPPISPATMPGMAAAPSMQGMPSTPAEAALPNAAYSNFSSTAASPAAVEPPPARMADARLSDPAAALPAAALSADAAAYGGSRYSTTTASRFSGAEAASFSPPPATPQASYGTPAQTAFPPAPAGAAPAAGPAGVPPGSPAAPGLLQPSMQPVRRPDPVYRPGGTSSYRPSRAILADDSAPASSAVRTAAYDEPAAGTIQQ